MDAPFPSEIKVRELLPSGVRYELPRRPLGALRWIGLVPLGFGALFSGFAIVWMIAAATAASGLVGWLFVLWGIPFAVVGCIPMALGLFIFAGRSVIELRHGQLRVIELAGPIRWSRSRPAGSVARFVLKASAPNQTAPPWLAQAGIMSGLTAEFRDQKPLVIAPGYPHAWTAALAAELSRRCAAATPSQVLQRQPVPVDVVEMSGDQTEIKPVERLDQPADSDIVLEATGDGVVLTIPPPGVWRGSKGLLFFGLFWCGFMTLFTAIMMFTGERAPWPLLLFLAGFWAIGLALLAGAVNMGRRRATFAVRADGLRIEQTGLFGAKKAEWSRDQIASICAGPSGMEVNEKPVFELQIHPKVGKKAGFLAGRNDAELQWLAAVLRQALDVPSK
jgi:hypothetical protein